jgi:uncharacterized membrane protein
MARIEESVEIKRPVDKVFSYTTDAKNWSKWQPFPEAEQTSPGPMGIGSTTKGKIRLMGLSMKWTAKVTEYEPNKKFGKNIISGPITNEQHNTYDRIEAGTKFTIVYNMKVGGLMKPFSPVVVSSLHKALKKALSNLKDILETQT